MSRVVRRMLRALAVLLALAAATSAARADDDDPAAWPRRSRAFAVGGGATYLRNESIGGPALFAEYGLGRGRWQWVPNATAQLYLGDDAHTGWGVQTGLDARWLARHFEPDHSASLQLFINAGVALHHVELGSGRVTRPVIGVGWGTQVRGLEDHRWAIRFAFRFELAPAFDTHEVARLLCRGQCTSTASSPPVDEGFKAILGFAW